MWMKYAVMASLQARNRLSAYFFLPRFLGLIAWLAMALSYIPTLRFYRLSPGWSVALPAIASLYLFYTLNSAYQYLRGRGGQWKGRVQADAPGLQ